ncbi:winged helix-turn-helix transcriptional regulator [Saccharopolyspora sp. MS10]|uniref:winged helix-turn-helix transcriptional regulator n=1 Tax=Saccharopolyspora sp. MS10 TaxID=3385973 RepID=UPI00399F279C
MDQWTERSGRPEQETPPPPEVDVADRMLISLLRSNACAETHDLASRVGLSRSQVRARLRRLERAGVVRGYHARTSALAAADGCVLVFIRFTGAGRATAIDLSGLAGVQRVHTLSSSWDYMLEAIEPCFATCGASGDGTLLGHQADIALLPVAHGRWGATTGAVSGLSTLLPLTQTTR